MRKNAVKNAVENNTVENRSIKLNTKWNMRAIAAGLLASATLVSFAACGDNIPASSSQPSTNSSAKIVGNFQGSGASSQQVAVEAWIAGFQSKNPGAKSPIIQLAQAQELQHL